MKQNLFHTFSIARSGAYFITALCLSVSSALADRSVTVDLSGKRIANGKICYADSGEATLDPARSYTYAVTGNVVSVGREYTLSRILAPRPISLTDLLNRIRPTSGNFLSGTNSNPFGLFPIKLVNKTYNEMMTTNIAVELSAKFEIGISAGNLFIPSSPRGQVQCKISEVNMSMGVMSFYPPGALKFAPGSKLVVTAAP